MDWTYRAIMATAVVAGWAIYRRQPRPPGMRWWEPAAIGLGAFCGGMLGAKLPFVLADWPGFLSGTAWFGDGKTILAGLVGGYFGAEAAEWALDIRTKMCDAFAVPLAVGVGIGRLGCYHAGCCHGVPTALPWGVDFGDGIARHPTQLYEAAFHFTAAAILWQLQRRGKFRGQLIRFYLVAYFVFRFATEFIRPEATIWLGLTGYQLATLVLAPFFALWCCPGYRPWWLRRRVHGGPTPPCDTGDGVLGQTQTVCPECLRPLPGTVLQRAGRVYLRRECPEHGPVDALVSSARRHYYLRHEVPHAPISPLPPGEGQGVRAVGTGTCSATSPHPGPLPEGEGAGARPGLLPVVEKTDCGCGCNGSSPGHRTCAAVLEITTACDLHCPVCFADAHEGTHRPADELCADVEAFLAARGPLDVLQLSGGEPLMHPELLTIIDQCARLPIEFIAINTNGLQLARDPQLAPALAARRPKVQLSLQLDGLDAASHVALRGRDLLAEKQAVLDAIARHNLATNLTCTVVRGVNEAGLGGLLDFARRTPQVRGITYQPATWNGRFAHARDPQDRVTLADVVRLLAQQSGGMLSEDDFCPLPCSHPNCCSFTFLVRRQTDPTPLTRLARYEDHAERLADRVTFKLDDARSCCGLGGRPEDFLRVVVKPFMDAYTYDQERVDECCIHLIRPGGGAMSFCRFNVLQRCQAPGRAPAERTATHG